jgi:energy-coupling factor transporter ATP-binding protein EcfA2
MAECKATEAPIGGAQINKFIGALDAESVGNRTLHGYFVSLGGFRETALEQERSGRGTPIVLMDGHRVVEELINGRILIHRARAAEVSGRLVASAEALTLDDSFELVAHDRGLSWVIYYTEGGTRTHFSVIHSDGTVLSSPIVEEIVDADASCGGSLRRLRCLNPPLASVQPSIATNACLEAYSRYLLAECGTIQLDGLPADGEIGGARLRLENLFIPLYVDLPKRHLSNQESGRRSVTSEESRDPTEGLTDAGASGSAGTNAELLRMSVGSALSQVPRLALLGPPGSGKSTLLKRLAVAYSGKTEGRVVNDDLPSIEWLPLFFRCRELGDLSRGSFAELLRALSEREPVRHHSAAFRAHVDRALIAGRVLLLVDGIDEISDPGDRAAFVCTLRATLAAYPNIAIVLTSRESGFRHVAAHLSPVCATAKIAAFSPDDIRGLTLRWHTELLGDGPKVRADAENLAESIIANDRIGRLAINPLLLTTLLLVKRWVGSLPTRRAALYGKAVEVLLMTWNTEAHEPISEAEALPQLCYVAAAMMIDGVQTVSRPRLARLLNDARTSLPAELGYVRGTVEDFINRVEDRSSLLIMSGVGLEDGRLLEFFEFRHLTFQEFLTARAVVEGWHPGRAEEDTMATVLSSRLNEPSWCEVIPLAAVLGGKASDQLLADLTAAVDEARRKGGPTGSGRRWPMLNNLFRCVADEAPAKPGTIQASLRSIVSCCDLIDPVTELGFVLARSKYGLEFLAQSERAFGDVGNFHYSSNALAMSVWGTISQTGRTDFQAAKALDDLLRSESVLSRVKGALGLMVFGYLCHRRTEIIQSEVARVIASCGEVISRMVFGPEEIENGTGALCAASLGQAGLWEVDARLLLRLLTLANTARGLYVRNAATLAFGRQPAVSRAAFQQAAGDLAALRILSDSLYSWSRDPSPLGRDRERTAAITLAWYVNAWPEEILRQRARRLEARSRLVEAVASNGALPF